MYPDLPFCHSLGERTRLPELSHLHKSRLELLRDGSTRTIQVITPNTFANRTVSGTKVESRTNQSRTPYAWILRPDRISRIL